MLYTHGMSIHLSQDMHPKIPEAMAKQKLPWRLSKDLLTIQSDLARTHIWYQSTPIDDHLHALEELLYQWALCTTVPQYIQNTDQYAVAVHDCFDECNSQSAAYHDHQGCQKKSLLFAGQTVCPQWCQEPLTPYYCHLWRQNGSYIVQVVGRGQYWHAHDHICECHPDAVSPDAAITSDVALTTSRPVHAITAASFPTPVVPTTLAPAAPAATSCTPQKPLLTVNPLSHLQTCWSCPELNLHNPSCPILVCSN